jgi:hypothetical protein
MMITIMSGFASSAAVSSSIPLTCDMCRSISAMSTGLRRSMLSASFPLPHTETLNPSRESTLAQLSRSVCSSSTMRSRIELRTSGVRARDSAGFTWLHHSGCQTRRPRTNRMRSRSRRLRGRPPSGLASCLPGTPDSQSVGRWSLAVGAWRAHNIKQVVLSASITNTDGLLGPVAWRVHATLSAVIVDMVPHRAASLQAKLWGRATLRRLPAKASSLRSIRLLRHSSSTWRPTYDQF